ncbi:hypothetical protein UY3_05743 [Chelonia mydas]|uniref:Uncharacterized protein n=1 Tax=Chelonia mydas TaxID=8469 RepID=M7BIL7_CHEMY|nr:hypothetical protein UY3_05743 [Chelonia mydas]
MVFGGPLVHQRVPLDCPFTLAGMESSIGEEFMRSTRYTEPGNPNSYMGYTIFRALTQLKLLQGKRPQSGIRPLLGEVLYKHIKTRVPPRRELPLCNATDKRDGKVHQLLNSAKPPYTSADQMTEEYQILLRQ